MYYSTINIGVYALCSTSKPIFSLINKQNAIKNYNSYQRRFHIEKGICAEFCEEKKPNASASKSHLTSNFS